uniref:Putative methyltransferase n=1 Tax=mine drainage metagenome TaxID=410659 RepID=E6Q6B1_9ZZZZ
MDAILHGVAPTNEQIAAYLNAFHHRMPGVTSAIMLGLRTTDGRSSYDVVADRIAAAQPANVLDIGCGDGELLAAILTRTPRTALAGVDLSAEELALTAARFTESAIDLRLASAGMLPFPDGAFAAVAAHLVFMLIPQVDAALREAYRVLAPGGTLAFLLPRRPKQPTNLTELLATLSRKIVVRYPEFSPFSIGDRALFERFGIADLLGRAGFPALPAFDDFEVRAAVDGEWLWKAISGRYILGSLDDELTAELRAIVVAAAANGSFDYRESLRLVSMVR